MDHDQMHRDVEAIKRFLDAHTDGDWRDPKKWRAGYGVGPAGSNAPTEAFRHKGDGGAGMVVDDEQTRRDRIALGLDKDPDAPQEGTGAAGGDTGTGAAGDGDNGAGGAGNSQGDPPQGS